MGYDHGIHLIEYAICMSCLVDYSLGVATA